MRAHDGDAARLVYKADDQASHAAHGADERRGPQSRAWARADMAAC